MQLRRFKDILAIKTPTGVVGFNARNLETAELSDEAWNSMENVDVESEAFQALQDWSLEAVDFPAVKSEFKVSSITLNVTQVCNLACKYCAAGGDGTYGSPVTKISVEKTLPQIKFFLEKLSSGDSFSINFLGGEPLLYPLGMELIGKYAQEVGAERNIEIRLSVTTNGTLFTEETVDMLNRINCSVTISMDGGREITDSQRPSKDHKSTFEKIMKGLEILAKNREGIRKIRLHGVYGKNSMEITKAYQFMTELPVDSFTFSYDHLETSPEVSDAFLMEMDQIAALAFARGGEKELRKIYHFEQMFSRLDGKNPIRHFCGAGQSYLVVDAKNKIYTCPWDVGNKAEEVGQELSLDHVKLDQYQGSLVEKNNCQTCWARNLCGGGCMYIHKNRTGSKNKKDSNFCNRTKHLLALTLMYYQLSRAA